MSDTIVKVENLNVVLSGQSILKDLNFEIKKGEMTAIIGPNGAGKTVLFKAMLGLLPYSGKMQWGKGIRVGYVPQKFSVDRDMPLTAQEFFKLKTNDEAEICRVLKNLEMGHDEHHIRHHVLENRLGDLSGGEQQKIFIAWAMINNPNVLLFDEPTAGIDIGSELGIYQLLKKMDENKNITIIFISHDLNIIKTYADKVICMNKKLICTGTPERVIDSETLVKLYGPDASLYLHEH
jgi:zinc transport system ATP-binding protein